MNIITHQGIDEGLCGRPVRVKEGMSTVELVTTQQMTVDDSGLVHGGYVFGLADYAAMLAVNHPNVVLGSADVKFLKPVKVGNMVTAEATVAESTGKKEQVDVTVKKDDETVFAGRFTCFVLDRHVLG